MIQIAREKIMWWFNKQALVTQSKGFGADLQQKNQEREDMRKTILRENAKRSNILLMQDVFARKISVRRF